MKSQRNTEGLRGSSRGNTSTLCSCYIDVDCSRDNSAKHLLCDASPGVLLGPSRQCRNAITSSRAKLGLGVSIFGLAALRLCVRCPSGQAHTLVA